MLLVNRVLVGFGVSGFATLRSGVSSILAAYCDLCCPYFLPKVMVTLTRNVRGQFVGAN